MIKAKAIIAAVIVFGLSSPALSDEFACGLDKETIQSVVKNVPGVREPVDVKGFLRKFNASAPPTDFIPPVYYVDHPERGVLELLVQGPTTNCWFSLENDSRSATLLLLEGSPM